jgi:hypothetical protein
MKIFLSKTLVVGTTFFKLLVYIVMLLFTMNIIFLI